MNFKQHPVLAVFLFALVLSTSTTQAQSPWDETDAETRVRSASAALAIYDSLTLDDPTSDFPELPFLILELLPEDSDGLHEQLFFDDFEAFEFLVEVELQMPEFGVDAVFAAKAALTGNRFAYAAQSNGGNSASKTLPKGAPAVRPKPGTGTTTTTTVNTGSTTTTTTTTGTGNTPPKPGPPVPKPTPGTSLTTLLGKLGIILAVLTDQSPLGGPRPCGHSSDFLPDVDAHNRICLGQTQPPITNSHQTENDWVKSIADELGLTDDERQQLHDAITNKGYDKETIRQIAQDIKAGRGKQPWKGVRGVRKRGGVRPR